MSFCTSAMVAAKMRGGRADGGDDAHRTGRSWKMAFMRVTMYTPAVTIVAA